MFHCAAVSYGRRNVYDHFNLTCYISQEADICTFFGYGYASKMKIASRDYLTDFTFPLVTLRLSFGYPSAMWASLKFPGNLDLTTPQATSQFNLPKCPTVQIRGFREYFLWFRSRDWGPF